MSITLNQARVRTARLLCRSSWLASTATSGSTTTLVDALRLKQAAGVSAYLYEGSWILRTAITTSDRERMVDEGGYAPTTGTLTFSPAASAAVSTDAFELWPAMWQPTVVEEGINEALIAIGVPEEFTESGVTDQLQYALSSHTYLFADDQIVKIEIRSGSSGAYTYRDIPRSQWWISVDRDTATLNFRTAPATSADTMLITAKRSGADLGALSAGADTVALPNDTRLIDWVATEACLWLLTFPAAERMGPDNQQRRSQMAAEFRARAEMFRADYQPKAPRSIFQMNGSPQWGHGHSRGW